MNATDTSAYASIESLLVQRYSCRGFRPEPVPRDVIESIVALAQRTASWCNAQPWHVAITSGAATDRFREAMLAPGRPDEPGPDYEWPREYRGVYLQRRRECGLALYDAVGIARGDRGASAKQARENLRLFGAPHVAIITSDEALSTYGAVDCGAYVANFILAATSLGVATIAQAALAARPQRVRDCLGLSPDRRIVCGISFGYSDAAHPANGFRTARAEPASAVAWVD
ncbi:nitroreductase [Variovorax sp. J31P207]|uniref:nitroreductase n=1 Tax=Variovorax sp. J31P207 TaxID=3053510 RepID=UPI0025758458|nr:nitroreductase [Variovorax sp. J31P207]MDM0066836.1 nitroreductase [Variovorax sp. J31P207]